MAGVAQLGQQDWGSFPGAPADAAAATAEWWAFLQVLATLFAAALSTLPCRAIMAVQRRDHVCMLEGARLSCNVQQFDPFLLVKYSANCTLTDISRPYKLSTVSSMLIL